MADQSGDDVSGHIRKLPPSAIPLNCCQSSPHTSHLTLLLAPYIKHLTYYTLDLAPTPDTNTTKPGLGLWLIRKNSETTKTFNIIQPTFIVYLKNILKFNSG